MAVRFVLPTATALTRPILETVAMSGELLSHVTVVHTLVVVSE